MLLKRIIIFAIGLLLNVVLLAQSSFVLKLEVNHRPRVSIYRNEPLLITLSISNPQAFLNAQWNREANHWLANLEDSFQVAAITKEKYREERKVIEQGMKKYELPVLGTEEKPWYEQVKIKWWYLMNSKPVAVDTHLITVSTRQTVIVLDENAYCLLQWAVFPKSISQLKSGKYIIVAEINNTFSDSVGVVVKPSNIPAASLQTEAVQVKLGRFYLLAKDKQKASMHAKALLKINPIAIEGWVLMGEVFLLDEAYAEALKQFERALGLFKKQHPNVKEPPEYLLSTIQWLKEKVTVQK